MSIPEQILFLLFLIFFCAGTYSFASFAIIEYISVKNEFLKFKINSIIIAPAILAFLSYVINTDTSINSIAILLFALLLTSFFLLKKLMGIEHEANIIDSWKYSQNWRLLQMYVNAYIYIILGWGTLAILNYFFGPKF